MVTNLFIPLGQAVDRLFGSAADWVGDGKTLSQRLWLARQDDRLAIDSILRNGLMTGRDPLAVARDLEDYLLPAGRPVRNPHTGRVVKWKRGDAGQLLRDASGRLIPANAPGVLTRTPRSGMGSYAARRLARTEVSHAFNEGVRQAAEANPFVDGVKWNLSGSHKDADECDALAQGSSRGLAPGVYRPSEFPRMPNHPHCLCYATQVTTDDVDAVVDRLRNDIGLRPIDEPLAAPPTGRVDIAGYSRSDVEAMQTALDASGARSDLRYSDAQRSSLKDYKASAYSAINRYLRDGVTKAEHYALPTPTIVRHVENIDAAFARATPTAEVIRVHRGSFIDFIDVETQQVGAIYQDLGYMSTSAKTGGAGFGRELELEIYVPPGSKVLVLDDLGPRGEATGEMEVLLPRNSAFVIRSIDAVAHKVVLELLP
jgi:hypothetical protein